MTACCRFTHITGADGTVGVLILLYSTNDSCRQPLPSKRARRQNPMSLGQGSQIPG